MNVMFRPPMSRDEFLDWAEREGAPYEFDGKSPIEMTGGSIGHDEISFRLRRLLTDRLGTGPCRAFGPNAGVATTGARVRYPDAGVTCTTQDPRSRLVVDPVILMEVVSPGSEPLDRIVKLREYQSLDSVRQYVIFEQDCAAATVLVKGDDGAWRASVVADREMLALPAVGLTLDLAAIYQGLVPSA